MKKILIYLEENELKNAGGPLGYNYNLKKGLLKFNNDVNFLKTKVSNPSLTSKLKKIKNRFLRSFLKGVRDLFRYIKLYLPFGHLSKVDLVEYDIVHFHDTFDLYDVRNSLKKFDGTVVLTTHSPILPCKEIGAGVEKWVRVIFFPIFLFEKKIDKYAFNRTNYIISPCEDAMNSYSKYWRKFDAVTREKVKYLITGVYVNDFDSDEEFIRNKYFLNKDNFNITYLGRHNKIKGYDYLKRIASSINDDSVRFIIGGNSGPIKPLKDKKWIEIGFTKDAFPIMKYSNIYISCNKDTYFDLATIQALSCGTIVLTKRNGGNLYFEKSNFPGVYLFSTVDEALNLITKIKEMSVEEIKLISNKIKENVKKHFDIDKFANDYLELMENL